MCDRRSKVAIIGCGAIGSKIAEAIATGAVAARLAAIWDEDPKAALALSSALHGNPPVIPPAGLVDIADLIVECASGKAVAPAAALCLANGKDLMVMSVGGLTPEIIDSFATSTTSTLHIPSGAVCGIDGIIAYADAGATVTLTTTKPPAGLKGAKYFDDHGIDLDAITGPTVVFEGTPTEGIRHFPKNINVSTTLSLASRAGDALKVRLVADPAATVNRHDVSVESPLGRISVSVENLPSPDNPKTSALAYLSAIAALKKMFSHVKIGT